MYAEIEDGKALLPRLHILVYKHAGPDDEEGFMAACLEFATFSWDPTPEIAANSVAEITKDHVARQISRGNIQQIIDEAETEIMENFWKLVRRISFSWAQQGELDGDVKIIKSLQKENSYSY
jgi:hypothetical protein